MAIDRVAQHVVEWEQDNPGADVWLRPADDGVQVLMITGATAMRMATITSSNIEATAIAGTLRVFIRGTLKRLLMQSKGGIR